jgi:hypothetical protein
VAGLQAAVHEVAAHVEFESKSGEQFIHTLVSRAYFQAL